MLPLYARLSQREQQRCSSRTRRRRIVLATNVAETSLTVPGIRYVVDPGLRAHQPLQRAAEGPAAADRAGLPGVGRPAQGPLRPRRGRHLHPPLQEEDFEARPRFTDPEILRTSLAGVILQMAAVGLGDVEDFPFLDPPDRRQVATASACSQELGALDEHATS